MNPPGLGQLSQGILDRHMQTGFQFGGVVAGGGLPDQSGGGIEQSAVFGKPSTPAQPQALFIKLRDGWQRVETTSMRVAGKVTKLGQLSENRDIDLGSQCLLHLRHGHGSEAVEEVYQRFKGVLNRAHIVE
jgi:hypothetical protein